MFDWNAGDPFLTGDADSRNAKLKACPYFDLAATAKVREGIVFRAGVNNLADKDPPAISQGVLFSFGNGNTYPGVYDVAGRTLFFGLTAEFRCRSGPGRQDVAPDRNPPALPVVIVRNPFRRSAMPRTACSARAAVATILLVAAFPAAAQLTGSTAATGSVSTTGTGSTGSSLGIGLGSGSLSGNSTSGGTSALPDVGGTSFGQPGTPLGTQSSLSSRINARAGLGAASRLNNRLSTGGAGYTGTAVSGVSSGASGVSGLSSGTTLSNAGQPSGRALGTGN